MTALEKKTLRRAGSSLCGKAQHLVKARGVYLKRAGAIAGAVLARCYDRAKRLRWVVFAPYLSCKAGLCPTRRTYTLRRSVCRAKAKCTQDARFLQLIDLFQTKTQVKTAAGSWWSGTRIPEPKQKAQWPTLLLQTRETHRSHGREQTTSHIHLLSLRNPHHARNVLSLNVLSLSPPFPNEPTIRKLIGTRIETLTFSRAPADSPRLHVVKEEIPHPHNRCKCAPPETIQYQLVQKTFTRVHAL